MYKCIRFNLYDIYRDTMIDELVQEINMSFSLRAKCKIHTEDYKRSENNMFVIIEVNGEEDAIEEAIEETQFVFDKKCVKSDHDSWFY